ncbi:MAG: tRNA glutamyl-Q(34) synthetase GluQRS [Pseudomonadota bacterium]
MGFAMLRFAPSPNGLLHRGHALSALANEAMADSLGLPLTVRVEDIDKGRARPEFETAILDDLHWLGVRFQSPILRQSTRFDAYRDVLTELREKGLVYPSFATRREIAEALPAGAARDPDGAPLFPGDQMVLGKRETARRANNDVPAALRLDMEKAAAIAGPLTANTVDGDGRATGSVNLDPVLWGDVILARKETPTSYHLAVVTDDAAQGITHVVRGADLEAATAIHRLLQTLLGLPAPKYYHHPLILGPDGRKLSKSNGGESLKSLREEGLTADELREELGFSPAGKAKATHPV